MEKVYPTDQKMASFEEMDERKPNIMMSGQNMVPAPSQTHPMIPSDQFHMDTSESFPRLHTDSSSSDHVLSPEVTCEKEVQSEAKWNDLDAAFDRLDYFQLGNFMDGFAPADDPFAPQVQYQMDQLSPLQDMFMYLQKPL